MKEETFNYSKVPHNFGLCATDTCPYTDTCLRRIAYTYAPSNNIFLYVLNPKAIESTAGKCKYYCSNKKVRYAKGFIHINPEKPDVPLNKNDAFQKVQKRRVQEKR